MWKVIKMKIEAQRRSRQGEVIFGMKGERSERVNSQWSIVNNPKTK